MPIVTSKGGVNSGALVGPGFYLTNTSPSVKLLEQADGVRRFQAHNLYPNSAVPANRSITLVSDATYAITLTGTVSITLSGATTGTVVAGTTHFTATTSTLTCASTTGSGTVHLRRTPSQSDYIATGAVAVYDLPYRYAGGARIGIEREPAVTNAAYPSQPTAATASTTYASGAIFGVSTYPAIASTVTVDPFGTQGALRLTWAGVAARYGTPAADVTRRLADAAGAAAVALWMRAVSGTVSDVSLVLRQATGGAIGTTTPTLTTAWQRVVCLGARIGGNGLCGWYLDSTGTSVIEVIQIDLTATAFVSSAILTHTAAGARAVDNVSTLLSPFPFNAAEGTLLLDYIPRTITTGNYVGGVSNGTTQNTVGHYTNSGPNDTLYVADGGVAQATINAGAPSVDSMARVAMAWKANDFAVCRNGGTVFTDTSGTVPAVTQLRFARGDGSVQDPVTVVRAALFPERKSNALLQTMSTP